MFFVSRFVEDGVNFSINSDDPLVCQTRVDLEQGVAFNKIGLTPAELTQAVCCLFLGFCNAKLRDKLSYSFTKQSTGV